ncbi:MAG TPA: Calx-beta domain-containing protein [Tepidisphaeraceae bacterium]|nr:Calx-beta domain-containing protein [Tepidisphaeraceae bacterium]
MQASPRPRAGVGPLLEALEDRRLFSTLTVTTAADTTDPSDGVLSLREVIAAAQRGDTIVFDAGLAGQTIGLTGGELAINKSLTILGTPGSPEAISGSTFGRVLNITRAVNVTLDNLVIRNGREAEGAGIYNNGGTLTISNCLLSDNITRDPYYNGGGIYNNRGTVTIRNSTLSGNKAQFQYLAGGGSGGAIYNDGGAVTISDSTLSGNSAADYGGGIYNTAGGTVTISNSGVVGNFAYGGEDVYNLGAVYLGGTSTIGALDGNPATPLGPDDRLVQIGDAAVTEGNAGSVAATFTVTLSAPSTQTITVAYATADGGASSTWGGDYQPASGTLTFAPGETSKTVTVLVNGDRLGEWNGAETFFVDLSSPTNASIADGRGVGTILDDEPAISISDVSKSEGKRGKTTLFNFTVTLSAAYDQAVTVSFYTWDGTAKAGEDYVAKSGTLTFAPGETTKTITIEVIGDGKREPDEYFSVDLFDNSGNSWLAKIRGTGWILR